MRNILILAAILIGASFNNPTVGQSAKKRIQPGRMYNSQDTLFSPIYGFTSQVPVGWVGTLPRETEVFLLTTGNGGFGEIYVFGRAAVDLQQLSELWKEGVDVTDKLRLKAIDPKISDQILQSEVVADGNYVQRQSRAFAATKCGNQGTCITVLAVGSEESYDNVSKAALQLLQKGTFERPSFESPYENFNWKEFLSNKLMITYDEVLGGARQTQINLCENGTFNANVKKRGIMRNVNPEYKNRMRGSWTVEGKGPEAILNLTFDKKGLSPLTVPLKLKDEELFVGDERYYASEATGCKK
ncbi:hypothetical protein [Aquiflexum gelatinilyticum]|uniref:hypothetical protein n=1 Tax=Aquiflexum gelatinilyticum TaxID=2961943 RepID=UPI002169E8F9|nr:hypothetical protein [Aquiflexum gelatinilyticum]MCS4435910.1 hypothetical protein [Aquiflexum gelatinilyticum]